MKTRIREIRQQRGLTQEQLAKLAKTTGATISRWESHPSRVTVPTLQNLARILDVTPSDLLGISPAAKTGGRGVAMIRNLSADALMAFDVSELENIANTPAEVLAVLYVKGDAMVPTLHDGDRALVDLSDAEVFAAGIYCIQMGRTAQVRRLSVNPVNGMVNIRCDNTAYSEFADVAPNAVKVIGRVVWVGHKL